MFVSLSATSDEASSEEASSSKAPSEAEVEKENAKAPTEAEVESVDYFLRAVVERACADDRAADDVLVELHSGVNGFGVRSRKDLVANLVAIMRRRHEFIAHAARTYAAGGPGTKRHGRNGTAPGP